MNALIVTRFSDAKQLGNTSTELQLQMCESYCAREGLKVIGTKSYEAVSASASNVARIAQLLEFCKDYQGKASVLVVFKLDRFARDVGQHYYLKKELLKMGISLRSASEPLDDSPTGQLMETVLAGVAQFDNSVRRERILGAMDQLLSDGVWPYRAPIGYQNVQTANGKAGIAQIDDCCSKDIVEIFQLYASGNFTATELADHMNDKGVVNFAGNKIRFHDMSIRNVLFNKFYIGILDAKKQGKTYEGRHQPLIGQALWQRVQERLCPNKSVTHQAVNGNFPLRDRLICGVCHKTMTAAACQGRNKTLYPLYYCRNKECTVDKKSVPRADFEKEFYEYLSEIRPTEQKIHRFIERLTLKYQARQSEFETRSSTLRKRLDVLEKEKSKILGLAKRGVLDDEDIKSELGKVKDEIAQAQLGLSESFGEEFKLEYLIDYATSFLRNMHLFWNQADPMGKVRLQRLMFPNGITYSYPGFVETQLSPIFGLFEDQIRPMRRNITTASLNGGPDRT